MNLMHLAGYLVVALVAYYVGRKYPTLLSAVPVIGS